MLSISYWLGSHGTNYTPHVETLNEGGFYHNNVNTGDRGRRQAAGVCGKCRWWASRSRRQVRVESAAGGQEGAGGRYALKAASTGD